MTVEKAIVESLKYDRAYARMQLIISDLEAKQRADDSVDLENGEDCDKSYDLMLDDFYMLQKVYGEESSRLWKMAESKAEFGKKQIENLANAIVQTAIEDYEMAISGAGNDSEKTLIEYFADQCDSGVIAYTKLNVNALLNRVRKKHVEFVDLVKKFGPEIVAETKVNRAKKLDMKDNTHKCPNCGGGLYSESQYGVHRIVCTGCFLSEVVKVDKKKSIKREVHYGSNRD